MGAARPEAVPSTADLAARASLHRAVVDAVLSLDEPGRSTVLLRFFDGRKPEEIARLQNTAVATVHTRMRRAFAVLRARLDREQGGRERWVILATPAFLELPAAASGVASTIGVLMSLKSATLMVLGVLVFVAIGVGLWFGLIADAAVSPRSPTAGGAPPVHSGPIASATPAPAPLESAFTTASAPASRSEFAPAATAPRAAVALFHVSDEQGRGVREATITFWSGGAHTAMTDADGDAVLALPQPRRGTLQASATGYVTATLDPVALVDGSSLTIDLVPVVSIIVHVKDPKGAAVAGASVEIATKWSPFVQAGPPYERLRRQTDQDGIARFDGVSPMPWSARIHASGFIDMQTYVRPGDNMVALEPGSELVLHIRHAKTGAPVPNVPVTVYPDGLHSKRGSPAIQTVSDAAGDVLVGRPGDATSQVTANWVGYRMDPSLRVIPPEESEVTLEIREAPLLACRVITEDGTPVSAALLEYASPTHADPVVAENGLFFVAGQCVNQARAFRFLAPGRRATGWKQHTICNGELLLTAYPRKTVVGRIEDGAGRPVAAVVTIEPRGDPSLGLGAGEQRTAECVGPTSDIGRFSLEVGGSNYYVLEVATSAGVCVRRLLSTARIPHQPIPFVPPPQVTFLREDVNDLGTIVVPAAGALRVTVTSAPHESSDVVVDPSSDAAIDGPSMRRATVKSNSQAFFPVLPEGEYKIDVRPHDGTGNPFNFQRTRVQVVGGKTTEITLPK
jgi:hypothetical protein